MKYEAFLFDLDGTLIKTSEEFRYAIVEKILRDFGIYTVPRHHIDTFWFRSNRDETIETCFGLKAETFWEHMTPLII